MIGDDLRNGRAPNDPRPDSLDAADPGDDLSARLAAYAATRLTPDPAAMARMRAALVLQARAGSVASERTRSRRAVGSSRTGLLGLLLRRPARAAAGGLLLVAVAAGAAIAASGPGGLLYPVRLWTETLTLPSAPGPRLDAELARLGARVADVEGAAASGNAAGVTAAINAYADELVAAQAAANGDPGRLATIADALARHRDVLAALSVRVPSTADPAIEAALTRAQAQIDAVLAGEVPRGRPSTPPGQSSTPPGQASTPPGQASTPPGQASTPPGQASTPPGQSSAPPSPKPGNPSAHPSPPPHPTPSPKGQDEQPSPRPTPRASAHPSPGG